MSTTSTLFDNFNAKNSKIEDVARTFVSSIDFFSIAKNNHTFVLGPRGCGKTTMFKMLTTPALQQWKPVDPKEIALKNNIPFIAIYFPSDELWKDQMNSITSNIKNDPTLTSTIINALACTNIFSNFCEGIKHHITYLDLPDKGEKEVEFCNELIKVWKLSDCPSRLSSIKLHLGNRKDNLIEKLNKYLFDKRYNANAPINLDDIFFSDFLTSIRVAIIAFENIFNDGNELKWALCFDELELVSKDFFDNIIKKLRVAPQNIVFKLSSSPLTEFENSTAQVFHDFEVVKLWPHSHSEEKRYAVFCEEIAKARILQHVEQVNAISNMDVDFTRIFGTLDYSISALKEFNFTIDPDVIDGKPHSLSWSVFRELGKRDEGFAELMRQKKLNPKDPVPKTKLQYDSFIRKARELVINRLLFSKYEDSRFVEKRTRKEYPIYYGRETIFRICEGNPRFIMNIINDILIKTDKYVNLEDLTFSAEEQANVIKTVSIRFNAMLNTYPTSTPYNKSHIDLEWLIKKVGDYFDNQVNSGRFKMSPANSFTFKESNTNKQIVSLINKGVGLGAFVKIDKNIDDISNEHTTRFRLSYLLHPRFKLPLRLYSSIKLNNILTRSTDDSQQFDF